MREEYHIGARLSLASVLKEIQKKPIKPTIILDSFDRASID